MLALMPALFGLSERDDPPPRVVHLASVEVKAEGRSDIQQEYRLDESARRFHVIATRHRMAQTMAP